MLCYTAVIEVAMEVYEFMIEGEGSISQYIVLVAYIAALLH